MEDVLTTGQFAYTPINMLPGWYLTMLIGDQQDPRWGSLTKSQQDAVKAEIDRRKVDTEGRPQLERLDAVPPKEQPVVTPGSRLEPALVPTVAPEGISAEDAPSDKRFETMPAPPKGTKESEAAAAEEKARLVDEGEIELTDEEAKRESKRLDELEESEGKAAEKRTEEAAENLGKIAKAVEGSVPVGAKVPVTPTESSGSRTTDASKAQADKVSDKTTSKSKPGTGHGTVAGSRTTHKK